MKKDILSARAEAALMGFVQSIDNEDDLKFILEYAKKVLNATYKVDEVLKDAVEFLTDGYEFKTVVFNKVNDMRLITMTIKTPADEEFNLLSEYGVFGYVHNIDYPIYSELGYSYFKRIGNDVVRIG